MLGSLVLFLDIFGYEFDLLDLYVWGDIVGHGLSSLVFSGFW